jgi:hypothetical protein
MLFRLIGIIALIALVIFFIRYFKGHYGAKKRFFSEKDELDPLLNTPIELIPKTQTFMDLPPIEAAVAVEVFNKQVIPLKSDGINYLTLFGKSKAITNNKFEFLKEPYEVVISPGYGQIWQSLVNVPKNKYDCTHILIGNSRFTNDRHVVEVAELQEKHKRLN